MNIKKIENNVSFLVKPILENLGYELVEVEFLNNIEEGNTLTVFIYKAPTTTIKDCQIVSNALDAPLDELNPTDDIPYSLNVSSPGLDRPLKTIRDFERNIGEELSIEFNTLKTLNKQVVGVLKSVENNSLIINQKGKLVNIDINEIIKALIVIKF